MSSAQPNNHIVVLDPSDPCVSKILSHLQPDSAAPDKSGIKQNTRNTIANASN